MPESYKEASERHFLEGVVAARGGLGQDRCPYQYAAEEVSLATSTAPLNWAEGWQFGRFTMMQTLRRGRALELQSALRHLGQFQTAFSEACRVSNQGLLQSGLKSIQASRRLNEIAASIKDSREFKLLHDLGYEFYLPWRPTEAPYEFRLFDRQLAVFGYNGNSEQTLRSLLQRYGEQHGIRVAWVEYVRAEPLTYPALPA